MRSLPVPESCRNLCTEGQELQKNKEEKGQEEEEKESDKRKELGNPWTLARQGPSVWSLSCLCGGDN